MNIYIVKASFKASFHLFSSSSYAFLRISPRNVKNFELSESFVLLSQALNARDYEWRSFLLSPRQFGFPNARLRFYLVAKLGPNGFQRTESDGPWPKHSEDRGTCSCCGRSTPLEAMEIKEIKEIKHFLDAKSKVEWLPWLVPEKLLQKESSRCFDVVQGDCCHSLCFTKAYGRYMDGTGSILELPERLAKSESESYAMQDFYGKVRYFTPEEVARLMGFRDFKLSLETSKELSKARALWALLGNSLNPQVVAEVCEACEVREILKRAWAQDQINED